MLNAESSKPKKSASTFVTAKVKKLLIAAILAVAAMLYVGYYNAVEDGEIRRVDRLTTEERGRIIDYCGYRLGIDTDLKTHDGVEMCRKK